MKIYKLTQYVNRSWDTFDSVIVCAESEDDAKTIHPNGNEFQKESPFKIWANYLEEIAVEEIGEANENQQRGVILASFNAG